MIELTVARESWPIAGTFRISRGERTAAEVVVVTLTEDGHQGRGECVPYARYDETVAGVVDAIETQAPRLAHGLDRADLQQCLPPGAARNAVDSALWDLEAKRAGVAASSLAGLSPLVPVTTAFTLSLDTPQNMGAAAREQAGRPLLKLKLTGDGDLDRVAAVRENAPQSRIIVDANEAWSPDLVESLTPRLAEIGVDLVEQPLPAANDHALASIESGVPLCADESCHTAADVAQLADRYDVVNIKLDKTGGLTEALRLKRRARETGLGVMVGCMVGTALAMAPAVLLAQGADFVDLDGPLLLSRDRIPGLRFDGSILHPPDPELWG